MNKINILTFVAVYLPGYKSGGPVRSVANIVEALGDEFQFSIVTSDRDAGDTNAYNSITVNAWNDIGKGRVFYAKPGWPSLRNYARLFRDVKPDVVYFNSLFQPTFTLLPLIALRLSGHRPRLVVVGPRGEFSPGALGLKKAKKTIFLNLVRFLGLYRNITFHASSHHETSDILKILPSARIQVAMNIGSVGGSAEAATKTNGGRTRVVFLSRVSKKKNLDFALKTLSQCKSNIEFNIYGPTNEADYWQICQKYILDLPGNVHAHYRGVASPDEVPKIMAHHDLFFLPTLGENFGHAIFEALLAGTPVLISDRTPWRDLQIQGAGWDMPLEAGSPAFAQVIDGYASVPAAKKAEARPSIIAAGLRMSGQEEAIEAHRRLFSQHNQVRI